MINVHQAVDAVRAHLAEFPDLLQTADLRLEEFDLDDRVGEWIITVSFADPEISGVLPSRNRVYKTFYVNGDSGMVKAMKIRNPFAPA